MPLNLRKHLSVAPSGVPDKPLLEAALVFGAFYLVSYAPVDASAAGKALGTASYQGLVLLELVPKALLMLYLMARSEGLAAFSLAPLRPADAGRGLATALGGMGVVILPSLAFSALGWTNPLLAQAAAPKSPLALMAPLVLLSSLAVGYSEELFFRAYLIRRLEQAGLARPWAAVAACLAFGSGHGAQGLPGAAIAAILGGWLSWRWLRGRDIHEVALGHAMYDAVVMLFALYGRAA